MKDTAFKRRGLHKLACPGCDSYIYSTVANLEKHGRPVCQCGAGYEPDRIELALLLGFTQGNSELVAEYHDRLSGFLEGQKGHVNKRHRLNDPEAVVLAEFEESRRKQARSNRLGALLPAPEPMAF